jgi:hypothetical protein
MNTVLHDCGHCTNCLNYPLSSNCTLIDAVGGRHNREALINAVVQMTAHGKMPLVKKGVINTLLASNSVPLFDAVSNTIAAEEDRAARSRARQEEQRRLQDKNDALKAVSNAHMKPHNIFAAPRGYKIQLANDADLDCVADLTDFLCHTMQDCIHDAESKKLFVISDLSPKDFIQEMDSKASPEMLACLAGAPMVAIASQKKRKLPNDV